MVQRKYSVIILMDLIVLILWWFIMTQDVPVRPPLQKYDVLFCFRIAPGVVIYQANIIIGLAYSSSHTLIC